MTGEFLSYIDGATLQSLGHYSATFISGATTGMAANAPIVSFRWADTGILTTNPSSLAKPRLAVILNIDAGAVVTTAFTAGQSVDIEAIIARGFTASDSGGNAVTASRARASMQPSLATDLRVATTAALTAGTRTLDAGGFACATIYTQNTAGCGDMQQSIYAVEATGIHPVVLTTNEGIILRVPTAQGAAGVVKYYATISWAEVSLFDIE